MKDRPRWHTLVQEVSLEVELQLLRWWWDDAGKDWLIAHREGFVSGSGRHVIAWKMMDRLRDHRTVKETADLVEDLRWLKKRVGDVD
jgi:hypothetical protein